MSTWKLWSECSHAKPLSSFPSDEIWKIIEDFHSFYHTFPHFRQILKDEAIELEWFHKFQQTWDECIDFLQHSREDIYPKSHLLHQYSCYVYNKTDLEHLERRLQLQLHVMNAKINDIILDLFLSIIHQSEFHISRKVAAEGATLPSPDREAESKTLSLYKYLTELHNTLKRKGAPSIPEPQKEHLWQLVVTRFREHQLVLDDAASIFAREFHLKLADLHSYSKDSLNQRQKAYRKESLAPTLRRRIYTYDGTGSPATFQLDAQKEEEPLHTIDIVNSPDSRWIVSSRKGNISGIVQHLPPITQIHPFTTHRRYKARGIRLFEPSTVDMCDGLTSRYDRRKPTYRFDSPEAGIAFQSALRGKLLLHTFGVERISSTRGSEGHDQPLKIWSDLEGKNRSLSFLVEESRPYFHIDVPLHIISQQINTLSENRLRLNLRTRKARSGLLMRRLSAFIGSSKVESTVDLETREFQAGVDSRGATVKELLKEMAYLSIEFTTSDEKREFQQILAEFFAGYQPNWPPVPPFPSPHNSPVEKTQSSSLPLPQIPQNPLNYSNTKDLDYRIRGLSLDCTEENLLSLLSDHLSLEPGIKGNVKSLAISQAKESKVAVISLKPRPQCLSDSGKDEWVFSNGDCHITVDTHFRGVTVLYAPKDVPHTIDICAVAGLGGHAWGSFKHKGVSQSFMWINDLHKDYPFARIMTYGSKTKLDGNESKQSLKDLGVLLRDELKISTRRRASTLDTPFAHAKLPKFFIPSIFIAHSLGGLTVKEALLQDSYDPEPGTIIHNLHGALFFGVPSHGMETTALEAMIRGQPNESLVRSIGPDSETLTELSQKFKLRFTSGRPKIVYFYELEESCCPKLENGQWKMTGTPKKILVNMDSATDGGRWIANVRMQPLNRNHSDLVKFSSPDDSDLSRVLSELTTLVGEVERMSFDQ